MVLPCQSRKGEALITGNESCYCNRLHAACTKLGAGECVAYVTWNGL